MRRVLALAGCVLLGSCGNQESIAGGGSDQPNSLDALVLRNDGVTPAAGAAARWVSGAWNPSDTTLDSLPASYAGLATVGADGRLHSPRPTSGVWHLEILDSAKHQLAVLDSLPSKLLLQPAAQWSGVLGSQGPSVIALAGTSRRVAIGPDHRFHLDWLTAGNYHLVGVWGSKRRELATRRLLLGQTISDDTLADSVAGKVVLADGTTPSRSAVARWVSGTWNPADTGTDTTMPIFLPGVHADATGRVVLARPISGVWHLEVIDSGAHQIAIVDSLPSTLVLQPTASWSGVLAAQGYAPSMVGLEGTSRRSVVGPGRSFRFEWLVPGCYRAFGAWGALRRDIGSRCLDQGAALFSDTLDSDSSEVSLTDLQSKPLRCALRGLLWDVRDTNAGQWYQAMDTSSRILPQEAKNNPAAALRQEGGRSFLRWNFKLGVSVYSMDGVIKQPWAGVGLGTAPNANGLDWSSVSAIRLLVRGRGAFRFQVNTHLVDSLGIWGQFGSIQALDASWRWVEISTPSLWPQGDVLNRGITWPMVNKGVTSVAFYAYQDGIQLDVADIRLRGTVAFSKP